MNKKTKLLLFLLVLASCIAGDGANSANITVIVNPSGEGEELRRTTPIVHLNPSMEICRPRAYTARDMRTNIEEGDSLLSEEGLDKFLGEQETQDLPAENQPRRNQNIRINVSSGWAKVGLSIANQSRFFLVITAISWRASAFYEGETYEAQGTLSSGYCSGPGSLPFLYFVPPGRIIEYLPLATKRPLENLTLFLTGFPAVDRSGNPSVRVAQPLNRGNQGGGGQPTIETLNPGEAIIGIPDYRGDLTLTGYFMNNNGAQVSSGFAKRVSFNTTSDFRIY